VADVLPRSFEKKSNASVASHQELDEGVDVASSGTLDGETNNDNLAKTRNVRDAVTPLAHMAYADQLEQKKSALMLILKKLVSPDCSYFIIVLLSINMLLTFIKKRQI